MINKNILVELKDGFRVERKVLTFHINKERRYVLYYKNQRLASNCLYHEILVLLENYRTLGTAF